MPCFIDLMQKDTYLFQTASSLYIFIFSLSSSPSLQFSRHPRSQQDNFRPSQQKSNQKPIWVIKRIGSFDISGRNSIMVKLATARESRLYGPRLMRNQWEYVNAGLYVFASFLLVGGFTAQLSGSDAKSGLVLLLIGLAIIAAVNVHDLLAHMAGIDYRWSLMGLDIQLALVEFAVPLVKAVGSMLIFLGILFLLIQKEKGYDFRLEKHALSLLIAGPALWVIGSIHNSSQIYERADGHVQILQKGVQIPFLMGSLLFLVGGALNRHGYIELMHHGIKLLVFKMQQMDGVRLEKLRGGAQERLIREREGQVPLILEDQRRRTKLTQEPQQPRSVPVSTPYKDVLIGQS
ncbi:uncharacterized protein LOC131241257 isoform X2 [Magnolia sinica]|uniref:uncharacterized protein LOC131241257 isoform X2 n=1 Tax=Magnolia sinica TaxID=86752 RepID=UPI0026587662|nr:uncharacterized protein LOC131241257 isoform X2 [Magnolia sinica]